MLIENSQALRNWLQTCLGKFSDADPIALAKYVVALIKKDKASDEMYHFLIDQLDIFLHKGTKQFVDLLFVQLETKEYLEGVESNDVEKVSSTTCPKVKRKSMLSPAERKVIEEKIAESKRKELLIRAGSLAVKSNTDVENTKKDSGEKNLERAFKRCKDYDERGYCIQGDMCEFDHGSDPLVVEREDVKLSSILNFNVKASDRDSRESMVSSTLIPEDVASDVCVPHHFPLCTLPPLPNSPSIQLLPPPPPPPPPLPPPLPLPPLPKTELFITEAYNPEAPGMCVNHEYSFYPTYNTPMYSKQPRNRELVGVTIEAPEKKTSTQKNRGSENIGLKRKLPVYSRLGPNPKKSLYEHSQERKNTLLLRKVPPGLNNIMSINEHFSKFGKVTNIEVCFENSSESALVKFEYPFEATAAYKSTEAVMNNRFIKVFYYNNTPNTHIYKTPQNVFERDSNLIREESESLKKEENSEVHSHAENIKVIEKPNNFSSRSNATRTVFNPSSFVLNKNDLKRENHAYKDDKKVALSKRLAIHKKMGALIEMEIRHQKSILSELNKTKNPKKKIFLKTALKGLQSTISKLQNDFKQNTDELRKCLSDSRLSKTETQKQLLDADLDLYKEENSGSNTAALLLKVNELKAKARALGLLPNGSKFSVHDKVSNNPVSSIKKDNGTLLVSGLKDKETLKKHFLQFGDVEKIEDCKLGSLVCFFSRKAAEKAIANGKQIGDTNLSISWCETQKTIEETSGSATGEDKDEIPIFVDDDDEEEEEDKESRSWRH